MGNRRKQDMDEIRQELMDIRDRIDALITRLADTESAIDDDGPIDIGIDDFPSVDFVSEEVSEPLRAPEPEPEITAAGGPVTVVESEPEPAARPEASGKPAKDAAPESEAPAFKVNKAWRVDIPGAPVSNIISGISLNDRVLLINTLFGEDPGLFQKTIAAFNMMDSLDEAESYIESNFPEWNQSSDVVYRLMMAVRRKLR